MTSSQRPEIPTATSKQQSPRRRQVDVSLILDFWKPFVTLSLSGRIHVKNNYIHLISFGNKVVREYFSLFSDSREKFRRRFARRREVSLRCCFKDWRWCCSNGFYECVPRSCFWRFQRTSRPQVLVEAFGEASFESGYMNDVDSYDTT